MVTIQPQTYIARCMKFIVHHEVGNVISPIFWRLHVMQMSIAEADTKKRIAATVVC
jgi:hypothetical protein